MLGTGIGGRNAKDNARRFGIERIGRGEQANHIEESEAAKGICLAQKIFLAGGLLRLFHGGNHIVGRIYNLIVVLPDIVGITKPPGVVFGNLGIGIGIEIPVVSVNSEVAAGHEGVFAHHLSHNGAKGDGEVVAHPGETAVERCLGGLN